MIKYRKAKLSQLITLIDEKINGLDIEVNGLGLCNRATVYPSIISYIGAKKFIDSALENKAVKALFITRETFDSISEHHDRFSFIIVDYPEDVFYDLHLKLCQTEFYCTLLDEPQFGTNCNIHPSVVIEKGVVIGNNVTIGANSVIRSNTQIGDNSYIGYCSVMGSQGFQILRNKDGIPYNVKHIGGTKIGRNVQIGDCVTICNALFEGCVVVGDNCQIDNHTQVAHNCNIGQGNILTSGVTLLGSAELRDNCWLAPGSLVMNRIVVENGGFVGVNSVANKTVAAGTTVVGTPAKPIEEYIKTQSLIKKLIAEHQ